MRKKCLPVIYGFSLFVIFSFFASTELSAQKNQEVNGVVKFNALGLQGVSVMLKNNPSVGTITDATGKFSIKADPNDILVITEIGYKAQEVAVAGKTFFEVTMTRDNGGLSEVIVVGYGTQTKASLTGAVSVVKGDQIEVSPNANVSNDMAGRTPGVIFTNNSGEPGNDGSNIYIRGISTYSGSSYPLVVIDGVANRPGGFDRIDPNDIESISVLKDASAAIYGAQSANGVILVTTKRGRSGKPTLTFNYNQGINTWAKTEKYLNSADYAQAVNEINIFGGGSPI
jgi:TonB-dependent starch-binding outer membrane protein SusC